MGLVFFRVFENKNFKVCQLALILKIGWQLGALSSNDGLFRENGTAGKYSGISRKQFQHNQPRLKSI